MEGRIPQGTITCERSNQARDSNLATARCCPQSIYSSRMDSVIHHVTTLPAMKSLLSVTHHDYLPNEYDAVVLEPDVYFQLNELKVVADGHLDTIRSVIFCFDHDVQHLQEFVDNCNTAYERRMAEHAGYSPLLF
jgi:hypothetical protein